MSAITTSQGNMQYSMPMVEVQPFLHNFKSTVHSQPEDRHADDRTNACNNRQFTSNMNATVSAFSGVVARLRFLGGGSPASTSAPVALATTSATA